MRAIWKVTFIYFMQEMYEWGRAPACEVASHDLMPCKPSHNWSPSVCPYLHRVSHVLQLIILPAAKFMLLSAFVMLKT
jgi:hypothetical protein